MNGGDNHSLKRWMHADQPQHREQDVFKFAVSDGSIVIPMDVYDLASLIDIVDLMRKLDVHGLVMKHDTPFVGNRIYGNNQLAKSNRYSKCSIRQVK
jgi:hypothetical protein